MGTTWTCVNRVAFSLLWKTLPLYPGDRKYEEKRGNVTFHFRLSYHAPVRIPTLAAVMSDFFRDCLLAQISLLCVHRHVYSGIRGRPRGRRVRREEARNNFSPPREPLGKKDLCLHFRHQVYFSLSHWLSLIFLLLKLDPHCGHKWTIDKTKCHRCSSALMCLRKVRLTAWSLLEGPLMFTCIRWC